MQEQNRFGVTSRQFRSLICGFPRHEIIVICSRHGQRLPEAFHGLTPFRYDPRVRPPLWCIRFWFTRVCLTRSVPRNVRSLVSIARAVRASRIVATDAFSDLLDAECCLPETKLFWVQRGLYLEQSGSTLIREREYESRNTRIVLLAISEYDRINYRRWGASEIRSIPVGSLNNGIYEKLKTPVQSVGNPRFDICLFEKGLKRKPDSEYTRGFKENWDNFLPVFSGYLNSHQTRLIVAVSRSSEREDVIRYLYEKLQYDFTITKDDDFATYRASDTSEVTIGIASTVLAESL